MKSLAHVMQPIQKLNIIRHIFPEDGAFPNNGLLPLLLYRQAFQFEDEHPAETIREVLETNSWTNFWEDGVYDYQHYHSTAHETLVCLEGTSRIQFGGPNGITLIFEKGDVVIIPAGVAHRKVDDADGFLCLGAYADGKDYDIKYGKEEEREEADKNIRSVPQPENDPLYGSDGPLIKNWLSTRDQNASVL